MPELVFKGKEFVYNHHLTVPFRPLEPHPDKSIGDVRLDGNLIIHGDNLHALKALLPMYSGKVDCIFIDPPYNTGHEGWCYNDNVNSPVIQEWLNNNPVGIEDGLRHDKWCAMMWPRLRLLHELLAETGSLWITLDDNEVHRAMAMLDEVYGENCCIGQLAWQKRTSRENRATLSPSIDHLLVYSKCRKEIWRTVRNLLDPGVDGYSNPDNDPNGPWKSIPFSAQGYRKNQVYIIKSPTGKKLKPPKGRCWGATEPEFELLKKQNLIYWPKKGNGLPRVKQYPKDAKGLVPETLWMASEVGSTEDSKKNLLEIFSDREEINFHAPKPHKLVQRIISIATNKDSIVLDSFAGTGTTAHSVLSQNKYDGGNRRFILVECEDYANEITAERMRRVINGYAFSGKRYEELLREKITWTKFRRASEIFQQIDFIKATESKRFDAIEKSIKNGELIVVGEKTFPDTVEGLGGEFTFCTLGEPIDFDRMLTGESLPSFEALGSALFHTATNRPFDASQMDSNPLDLDGVGYLGASESIHVWLIYKPELDFLKSRDAALTLAKAEAIAARAPDRRHLIFAPARFVSQKMLSESSLPVEFAPLPFALYRIERGSQS